MKPIVLQENPTPEDTRWSYRVSPQILRDIPRGKGKLVIFNHKGITLQINQFPQNRILHIDDPSQFILASFEALRFPETKLSVTAAYMNRVFESGFFLNGVQYRFYHHSNSQLRGRSCFLRVANSDEELDRRIYALGEFGGIMNIAKRAKRIGLLFSGAEIDYQLDPRFVADIPDIKSGDELFSDGCGLISRRLLIQLSKRKNIIFRDARYTPCVVQIRYLGYKGVVMLHPQLDKDKRHLIQFRQSMKKFRTTADSTFSAVDYSKPFTFGRLNHDIIVLLSSLGITNEKFLAKQEEYFRWITDAALQVDRALDFLSCLGEHALAERVLLDGLDNPRVSERIRGLQNKEVANFRKNEKTRVRMMIHKSRLLFGVCDPFKILKEGEVHVRITSGRKEATSLTKVDVLVVRNPCLHPGDCLKLRAVYHPQLTHLVDCVVFASVGKRAAPSMSSGGDLDGDQFFICWDPDIVPTKVAESYTYPPNRENVSGNVKRSDLANHFASYNNVGLAQVASLHQKWARGSAEGALSSQCQELNALHSQAVDGARVRIPDRLKDPPQLDAPFVVDVLVEAAQTFASQFAASYPVYGQPALTAESAETLLMQLLKSEQRALSEYELFNLARSLARQYNLDIRKFLLHIDFGALNTREKYELSLNFDFMTVDVLSNMWNSLFRSDILTQNDLQYRGLNRPLRMQRLYSSRRQGLASFFEYLQQASEEFTRKLVILKTDDRFAIGIFIRGQMQRDYDSEVCDNVVVCSFMATASDAMSNFRPCAKGYRLYFGDNNFQLYNLARANTFIFVTRPPEKSGAEIKTSIALDKISQRVQRQIGRINRTTVNAIEIHVISNRDRVAHQLFDLRFEHVQTEEYVRRLAHKPTSYVPNTLLDFDWTSKTSHFKLIFSESEDIARSKLSGLDLDDVLAVMEVAIDYHCEDRLFWAFEESIKPEHFDAGRVVDWIERHPALVYALLKTYPPTDPECQLSPLVSPIRYAIIRNIIRSANLFGMASLVALEKISSEVKELKLKDYIDIVTLASLSVRARNLSDNAWLVQEILLVLDETRRPLRNSSSAQDYIHQHVLAVAFDLAEEAAEECPCDIKGNILRNTRPGKAPTRAPLIRCQDKPYQAIAHVRVDAPSSLRLHSHVRLQAASKPEKGFVERAVLDGLVVGASKGELTIEVLQPLPPEFDKMEWNLYNAGSVATSRAMFDALLRLGSEQSECCRFYGIITSGKAPLRSNPTSTSIDDGADAFYEVANDRLNESQIAAVKSTGSPLTLIWGPPGTGKTTVVIEILRKFLSERSGDSKILMTASTHNAVDNVLERFVADHILENNQMLRVATDYTKVSKHLQAFTIDARVGGDVNQNERLKKEAEKRVKEAVIIFTTVTGAGLGTLRHVDFDIVLIDEASQVTEPCALIPLVKGCRKAVLVGDHVQLRPTVRPMGKALQYDVSLLERLYTGREYHQMARAMLDVQYRFPEGLARFPSHKFYQGRLRTGVHNAAEKLQLLERTKFPWPKDDTGLVIPTVFVPCDSQEDFGGSSKANIGQAQLVGHIAKLLSEPSAGSELPDISVTALTPYSKQTRELRNLSLAAFTIDSFQGRESDVIILSTVRCNDTGDIGFVEDERRLNVAWTRAKLGLIIVGNRNTLQSSLLWKEAIDSCHEISVTAPEI